MFKIYLAALMAVFSCPTALHSQDLYYTHYGVDDGLPSSQVHDIIQDQYGRLWFTTDQGLSCYDGYKFKNYTTTDGLTDNTVFKFFPQADGKIWCTTFNKTVFYFSGKEPAFVPYRYNHKLKKNISDNIICNNLAVTAEGSLYMGFANEKGYVHITTDGRLMRKSFRHASIPNHVWLLTDENNTCFFYSWSDSLIKNPGRPWKKVVMSTLSTLKSNLVKACYLPKKKTSFFFNHFGIEILPDNGKSITIPTGFQPISMGPFTDETFWVGFRYGGVSVYNLKGQCLFSLLKGKSVTRLLIDHEGGYWCSTLHDGVFHARNTKVFSYKLDVEKAWIHSLRKDNKGRLWIGYYHGNVDVREKGRTRNVYAATTGFPAYIENYGQTGEVLLFTDNKAILPNVPQRTIPINASPLGVYIPSIDSIVTCGYGGIITFYKGKRKSMAFRERMSDMVFYQNNLYLATNNGLYTIQQDTCLHKVLDTEKLLDLKAWNNRILMASKNSGIVVWDGQKKYEVNTSHGLCSNVVQEIYVENDSVIWALTNTGMSRIVLKENKVLGIRNLSTANGLISNEVTAMEVVNDTIWVGTRQGLCCFPYEILHSPLTRPTAHYLDIGGIIVNDRERKNEDLELSYDENRVEFLFSAISFSESQRPQYRYQLAGLENNWQYTNERSALYASVPPGTYVFQVQAKTAGADWGKVRQYSFIISPPFWKTWWFTIAVITIVLVLIYLFFRFRILSYNRDITRELLRQLLKRLRGKTNYVVFREQGKDIRIATDTICYVKADGNYIEIHTDTKKYVIRHKIGEFLELVPDPLEYLRINRSYIVRIDKIQEKSKKEVTVSGEKISVGETYLEQLQKIKF